MMVMMAAQRSGTGTVVVTLTPHGANADSATLPAQLQCVTEQTTSETFSPACARNGAELRLTVSAASLRPRPLARRITSPRMACTRHATPAARLLWPAEPLVSWWLPRAPVRFGMAEGQNLEELRVGPEPPALLRTGGRPSTSLVGGARPVYSQIPPCCEGHFLRSYFA